MGSSGRGMSRSGMGGFSGARSGGFGGGMNRNIDRGMGMNSNRSGGAFGRGGARGSDKDVNPDFDSLYTPEFGSKNSAFKSSAFDTARSKLKNFSSSPSTPGSYKGPSMGPPKKTWSN